MIFQVLNNKPTSEKMDFYKHKNWLTEKIRAVAGQHARLLLTFVKHKAKPDQ